MQMEMEIWSRTWTLEVGGPVPETLLLTLCTPHAVLAVHGFNFHPSMVITGFFLDPSVLLIPFQNTYTFSQVVSSSGNMRCFFLLSPHTAPQTD